MDLSPIAKKLDTFGPPKLFYYVTSKYILLTVERHKNEVVTKILLISRVSPVILVLFIRDRITGEN